MSSQGRSYPLWSRRRFVALGTLGAGALMVVPGSAALGQSPGEPQRAIADTVRRPAMKPPPLEAPLVKEFVGAAHGDLDRTRALLEKEPGLLNATWDWKAGDFETAIGGAGHMGRRDIALYLLEHGARMDVFVAAMLGELEIVKAFLAAYPSLAQSKGPHGISLIAHAQAGKAESQPVLAYLEGLG